MDKIEKVCVKKAFNLKSVIRYYYKILLYRSLSYKVTYLVIKLG